MMSPLGTPELMCHCYEFYNCNDESKSGCKGIVASTSGQLLNPKSNPSPIPLSIILSIIIHLF
jgi:hypothetical protein